MDNPTPKLDAALSAMLIVLIATLVPLVLAFCFLGGFAFGKALVWLVGLWA